MRKRLRRERLGKRAVEGRETAIVACGDPGEVAVRGLPVTDQPVSLAVGVREVVCLELKPRVFLQRTQQPAR